MQQPRIYAFLKRQIVTLTRRTRSCSSSSYALLFLVARLHLVAHSGFRQFVQTDAPHRQVGLKNAAASPVSTGVVSPKRGGGKSSRLAAVYLFTLRRCASAFLRGLTNSSVAAT
mmetsp:Transcript_7185/g.13266  ORF Transcript_7185/g.13266 Transcript_7185/m.13266 type:complete len:114 (+) Transcript_7185:497-838(+)